MSFCPLEPGYSEAFGDCAAHGKEEPPEPLFFGRAKWERERRAWQGQRDEKFRRMAQLWEKAGGDMRLKQAGLGKEEASRRKTDEYARGEAEKRYSQSGEWKAIAESLNADAAREAGERDPETKKELGGILRELAGREREETLNSRIAELDRKLERPAYSPGSAGFSLLADYAKEAIRLERERGGLGEAEAMRLHPAAAAILEKHAEHRRRGRGWGR